MGEGSGIGYTFCLNNMENGTVFKKIGQFLILIRYFCRGREGEGALRDHPLLIPTPLNNENCFIVEFN